MTNGRYDHTGGKRALTCLVFMSALLVTTCAAPGPVVEREPRYRYSWQGKSGVHRIHPNYSISGDGRWVAFTTLGKPQNTISLLNVETGNVFDLQAEDTNTILRDPDLAEEGTLCYTPLYRLAPEAETPFEIEAIGRPSGDWTFRSASSESYLVHFIAISQGFGELRIVPNDLPAAYTAQEREDWRSQSVFVSGPEGTVHGAAISWNGRFVVEARRPTILSEEVTIKVWDMSTGNLLQSVSEPKAVSRTVAIEGGFENDC